MAAAETRGELLHIRGEGGAQFMLRRPLAPGIEDRLATGALRRVNADGTPYAGEAEDLTESVATRRARVELEQAAEEQKLRETHVEIPARNARKAELVAFAVSTGEITKSAANDLTVSELVARFVEPAELARSAEQDKAATVPDDDATDETGEDA